jgi:prephenate dehydrogenase
MPTSSIWQRDRGILDFLRSKRDLIGPGIVTDAGSTKRETCAPLTSRRRSRFTSWGPPYGRATPQALSSRADLFEQAPYAVMNKGGDDGAIAIADVAQAIQTSGDDDSRGHDRIVARLSHAQLLHCLAATTKSRPATSRGVGRPGSGI